MREEVIADQVVVKCLEKFLDPCFGDRPSRRASGIVDQDMNILLGQICFDLFFDIVVISEINYQEVMLLSLAVIEFPEYIRHYLSGT